MRPNCKILAFLLSFSHSPRTVVHLGKVKRFVVSWIPPSCRARSPSPHAPVLLYPDAVVRGPRSGTAPCSCRSRHGATSSLLAAAAHVQAAGTTMGRWRDLFPPPWLVAVRRYVGPRSLRSKPRLLRVSMEKVAGGAGLRAPQRQLTLPPATGAHPQTHGST